MVTARRPAPKRSRRRCTHYWVIGPQNGPRSEGRCKRCGRRRRFDNSTDDRVDERAERRER